MAASRVFLGDESFYTDQPLEVDARLVGDYAADYGWRILQRRLANRKKK